MTEENTPAAKPDLEAQQFIDPHAPLHKRIIQQPINDQVFEFHWTRLDAAELIYILAGRKETPNETSTDGMRRMLLKTVDRSQKGLLLDILNNKSNYTLARKLIEGMLALVTDNETIIGTPEYSQQGDVKRFVVPLMTDGQTELFDFKTDRNRFDEFQQNREDPASDSAEEMHSFLYNALADKAQQQRYRLLAYDERNFTLSVKLFSRVNAFLARNQDTTVKPTLKK